MINFLSHDLSSNMRFICLVILFSNICTRLKARANIENKMTRQINLILHSRSYDNHYIFGWYFSYIRLYLAIFGSYIVIFRWYLDNIWRYLVTFGDIWRYLVGFGWYLAIYDEIWWYLGDILWYVIKYHYKYSPI